MLLQKEQQEPCRVVWTVNCSCPNGHNNSTLDWQPTWATEAGRQIFIQAGLRPITIIVIVAATFNELLRNAFNKCKSSSSIYNIQV